MPFSFENWEAFNVLSFVNMIMMITELGSNGIKEISSILLPNLNLKTIVQS